MSSSGSDGSAEDGDENDQTAKLGDVISFPDDSAHTEAGDKPSSGVNKISSPSPEVSRAQALVDKEDLVRKVVEMLDNEREEDVKVLLKDKVPGLDKVCVRALVRVAEVVP